MEVIRQLTAVAAVAVHLPLALLQLPQHLETAAMELLRLSLALLSLMLVAAEAVAQIPVQLLGPAEQAVAAVVVPRQVALALPEAPTPEAVEAVARVPIAEAPGLGARAAPAS
jgi:hypothetical protein